MDMTLMQAIDALDAEVASLKLAVVWVFAMNVALLAAFVLLGRRLANAKIEFARACRDAVLGKEDAQ